MAVEKVREYFRQFGIADRIMEFDVSSATVELAAEAVGVEGARICKTLSFHDDGDGCVLVQLAGDAKVNNGKFKRAFGFKPSMLDPDAVLVLTGHEVGGVCAFGLDPEKISSGRIKVYCDESLKRFDTVFPACGSGNSAIELTPDELYRYSGALSWVDVAKIPEKDAAGPAPGNRTGAAGAPGRGDAGKDAGTWEDASVEAPASGEAPHGV